MSEPLSTTTRDRLVTAVAELMRTQGYSAITVKQITAAANAPMGSLYHHFPGGKAQIAAAALRTSGAAYIQLLPLLMDPYDDLRTAIPAAFDAAAETIEQSGWINMCPVGTVAGEVADSEPVLREVAAEVINSWIDQGTTYFVNRGLAEADARDLIYAVLAALEGAFVLSRTLRSPEPLQAAGRALAARIDAITAAGSQRPISYGS
ncbi:TetR/AcrR family transcriptional regulator [Nocardia sp. 2]|uniref:TetR/AcrR family transcriptional regulator n=1 Tax=Nocardia acididurans TaxID=2802282 RepID=A0ABS1MGW5_9NOCA|nr:TetR/AcrR family transcriptional regulator [Nocardia acididurans]MBL1078458.1 TetR/AcrR family transcriptional regulator [Nocardia acididurans]